MKILTAEQLRNVDALTIAMEPIKSINLMERAALACFRWIDDNVSPGDVIQVFCGHGNNGGDGLAITWMLLNAGYFVELYMLAKPDKCSPDTTHNYERLRTLQGFNSIYFLEDEPNFPISGSNGLIIDALFGTGMSRPLEGLAAKTVARINQSEALVIAIDVPSGLFTEHNGDTENQIVKADITLTFQVPKLSFMFAENEVFTGEWHHLDIQLHPAAIEVQKTCYAFLQSSDIWARYKPRKKFSHKGTFGHALLIAGQYGRMGAAVLSSQACLRGGVGLLTSHIIQKGYDIMQTAVPEAMVSIDPSPEWLTALPELEKYNAIGIGPGIGTEEATSEMFYQLLLSAKKPLVIDADALNLLSRHPEWMALLSPDTILTPHPGEFDRLTGKHKSGWDRHLTQIQLSKKYNIIVILKGAFTSITDGEGNCYFNSSGNPGMATGGSGDVLTGITLSLLAQGYPTIDAAITAVYIHGVAGDLAKNKLGEEAILASDIIKNTGAAFKTITNNHSK